MLQLRAYKETEKAVHEHKWIESEKARRDRGVVAERDWVESYWRIVYRSRVVPHLRGEASFYEYIAAGFGVLSPSLGELLGLPKVVFGKIQQSAENLGLLRFAYQRQLPNNKLPSVPIAADINGRRLQLSVR